MPSEIKASVTLNLREPTLTYWPLKDYAEAIGLPMVGEKWYKKKTIRIGDLTTFLKPQYSMVDWR